MVADSGGCLCAIMDFSPFSNVFFIFEQAVAPIKVSYRSSAAFDL